MLFVLSCSSLSFFLRTSSLVFLVEISATLFSPILLSLDGSSFPTSLVDLSLALSSLDWQPQVALEDGLRETISYFKFLLN